MELYSVLTCHTSPFTTRLLGHANGPPRSVTNRERAEEQADAAKLDPEAAAKAKEEKRAASEVEAMLNAIMAAKDAKDAEEKK